MVYDLGVLQPKAKGETEGEAYRRHAGKKWFFFSPLPQGAEEDGPRFRRHCYDQKPAPQAIQSSTFIFPVWNMSSCHTPNQFGAAVLLDPIWLPTDARGTTRSRSFPSLLDDILDSHQGMMQKSLTLNGEPLDEARCVAVLDRGHRFGVHALLSILDIIAPRQVVNWVKNYVFI